MRLGYLAVGMTFRDQAQHFLLSPGEVEIEMISGMHYSILSPGNRGIVLFQLLHTFLQCVHQVNGALHFVLEK